MTESSGDDSLPSTASISFSFLMSPAGVMKYTLRTLRSGPETLPFLEMASPSSSSLFARIAAWEREIPTASAIPSCVSSRGMPYSVVSDMWR